MTDAVAIAGQAKESTTVDDRWAAWVAKGEAHDRKIQKRVIVAGTAAAAGIAFWLTFVLMFG